MSYANINNARLWYKIMGEGQPVLLHHGYTASRDNWLPVAQRLQANYQVILIECRGTGASEHTRSGYTIEQFSSDVIGLLDYLGIDTVTFAGHSMGGAIGYTLALQHARRLANLILMAPIPSVGIGAINPQQRKQRMDERRRGDKAAMLARYQTLRFRPDVETDEWFRLRVEQLLAVSDGHFEGCADAMEAFNVADRLDQIRMPTLMIAGAVDSLLQANLEDFARLPNASLEVYAHAGHEVAIHEPDRVAHAIDNFLQLGVVTAAQLLARLDSQSA